MAVPFLMSCELIITILIVLFPFGVQSYEKTSAEQKNLFFFMPSDSNFASFLCKKYEKTLIILATIYYQTPLQTTPRPLKFPSPFGEGAGVRPRGRGGVSVFLHITPFISFL
jgi:hypothetical protein